MHLNIPENKIMLAFCLAAPEVENDRRSLNTIAGMRRAMKEGRHCNMAPRGYRNVRDNQNNPIIVPGKDSPLIKWAFDETAKGMTNVMEIWRTIRMKGMKISRSQMFKLLRNPVYCGRIFIPAYENEEMMVVKASHEPIITKELFDDVQDVLNGRKRKRPLRNSQKAELPLRGYLKCTRCGKKLTGSASKGNGGKYFYYHCTKGCKERLKAEEANYQLTKELVKIRANANCTELYQMILGDTAKLGEKERTNTLAPLKKEIEKYKTRSANARQLMLDKEIESKEYKEIKDDYEAKIR